MSISQTSQDNVSALLLDQETDKRTLFNPEESILLAASSSVEHDVVGDAFSDSTPFTSPA